MWRPGIHAEGIYGPLCLHAGAGLSYINKPGETQYLFALDLKGWAGEVLGSPVLQSVHWQPEAGNIRRQGYRRIALPGGNDVR